MESVSEETSLSEPSTAASGSQTSVKHRLSEADAAIYDSRSYPAPLDRGEAARVEGQVRTTKEEDQQVDELRAMHLMVWDSHIDPIPAGGDSHQTRMCSVCSAALLPSSVLLDASAGNTAQERAFLELQQHRAARLEAEGEAQALRIQLAQRNDEVVEHRALILQLQKLLKTESLLNGASSLKGGGSRSASTVAPTGIAPGTHSSPPDRPSPGTTPPEDSPLGDASPGGARTRAPEQAGGASGGLLSSAANKPSWTAPEQAGGDLLSAAANKGWASAPSLAVRDGAPEPRADQGLSG
ncbi:hypothetical protein T484DRAFT_2021100, partial [Baffinella frigidus]